MKQIFRFLKTTLIGGFFIVLPVWLCIILIIKSVTALSMLFQPLIHELPEGTRYPYLWALLALVLGCFLVGLAVRTTLGRYLRNFFETRLFDRIPGYRVIRGLSQQLAGENRSDEFAPCLAEIEEALVPAFIVERHTCGRFTVFVPSAPTPAAGSVYILTPERVHPVDVSLMKAVSCISKWGSGAGELLAAMKPARP